MVAEGAERSSLPEGREDSKNRIELPVGEREPEAGEVGCDGAFVVHESLSDDRFYSGFSQRDG